MFNFTNSSIDMKLSNGYIYETENPDPIEWMSDCADDEYILEVEDPT